MARSFLKWILGASFPSAMALVAALAGPGCGPKGEEWHVVHLSGSVWEAPSGLPIDSAWVALDDSVRGTKAFTDTVGAFDLATLRFARGILYAGKAGYRTASKAFTDVDSDIDSIAFDLERVSD